MLKKYSKNFCDQETHAEDVVGLFFRQELKILFPLSIL